MTSFGGFRLTSVTHLPNVQVTFPSDDNWTDGKANETITPGELVVPVNSGGHKAWARAASGTVDVRASIALHPIGPADTNPGSIYNEALGPNEINNLPLVRGDWVNAYRSGGFALTLFEAAAYVPGDLLMFDPAATPQTGKSTTGAWKKTVVPANAFLEIDEFVLLPGETTRGILHVKTLRSL